MSDCPVATPWLFQPIQFNSSLKKPLPLDHGVAPPLAAELEDSLRRVNGVPRTFNGFIVPGGGTPGTYLGLIGDSRQGSGDGEHVDDGGPGVARAKAEVLVAVGVELWKMRQ